MRPTWLDRSSAPYARALVVLVLTLGLIGLGWLIGWFAFEVRYGGLAEQVLAARLAVDSLSKICR